MSTMIVDPVQQEEKLTSLLGAVSEASVSEKDIQVSFEKRVNEFLDNILESKKMLQTHAEDINKILPDVEEITWFRDVSDDLLPKIKRLIDSMTSLSKTMDKTYIKFNRFYTKKNINKKELKFFKQVADDVKEISADLHEVFFVLPYDDEFQDLCKELNDL